MLNATLAVPTTPTDALTPDEMLARFMARDAAYDGRFFTGVLTTGIYCLASCPARRPLQRNVRFFRDVEAARKAGLRACRRCYPDDFENGVDPVIEQIEALTDEARREPSSFPDVASLVRRSGYGTTRLFELFKRRYGTTPAAFLLDARLTRAMRLLQAGDGPVCEVAYASGFRTLSTFHESFKRCCGVTPAVYRAQTR
ncbi:MAG TPA: Ada metal-binding domain-containing protein, partial [Dehalococcoidia bacterium]|nr:Ada metal-binding domain-containing protein [Dehalococcoidia bacterium]